MINIAIAGATGRMGRELVRELSESTDLQLSNAFVSPNSQYLGQDIGELVGVGSNAIKCTHEFEPDFDMLIDFSTVNASMSYLEKLQKSEKPVVLCTTGFDAAQQKKIEKASSNIPLLKASNTSIGITLLLQLVRHAVSRLKEADIEIIEAHHRNKVDAPSGTAVTIGETAAQARGISLDNSIYQRHGNTGIRPSGPIGFSAIRAGDIVGDHTVLLAMDQERIEISHKADDRSLFAKGAIKAAKWLATQPSGRVYSMEDVLEGLVK